MSSKNILISACYISPCRGSEWNVAWNYVTQMSKEHHLFVLWGVSGIGFALETHELDDYLKSNPVANVDFIKVEVGKWALFIDSLNQKGFYYLGKIALKIWNKKSYKVAKQIIEKQSIDVVHFLNPIGYTEPGYLWKLEVPHIWGPTGGLGKVPVVLLKSMPIKSRILYCMKDLLKNHILPYCLSRPRKAAKHSSVVIAATTIVQQKMEKIFHRNFEYYPENGINSINQQKKTPFTDIVNLVWIGSIDARKALIIMLKALDRISDAHWQLHILGDGHLKEYCRNYAKKQGIANKIIWYGHIARQQVMEVLNEVHLHIISSLDEGNPTVVIETLSYGIPTITLDHCGMHDTINETCGIKIPVNSYEQVIVDLSKAVLDLVEHPDKLKLLSEGALLRAQQYTWDKRIAFFSTMYDRAIERYKNGKNQ